MRPGAPRPTGKRPPAPSPASAAAMAGAVDLAAVKARTEAAARAAEAPAPAAGQYVFEVTEASFQAEVLDRSFQVPVLLALTSARAPSGDQLVASLKSIVTVAGGTLVLGTVDVDTNPRIAQALQAQGVPAVYAVISGQLVPGFEGALPDEQVREFVNAVCRPGRRPACPARAPRTREQPPAGGPPAAPETPRTRASRRPSRAGRRRLRAGRAALRGDPGRRAQERRGRARAQPGAADAASRDGRPRRRGAGRCRARRRRSAAGRRRPAAGRQRRAGSLRPPARGRRPQRR